MTMGDGRFALRKAVWLALMLAMPAGGEEIPSATVVRFNTVCATCHEGECSGRLSFQSGLPAATNHLRRYLGALSERDAADLFALLKYTKEHCRHYPVKAVMPSGESWTGGELEQWRNPVEGGYFIPLGALQASEYRVSLAFSGDPQGKMRVTDARFEIAGEEPLCRGSKPVLAFSAQGGEHYLHVQTHAVLLRVDLTRLR